jgi:hypothetical protein
VFTIPVKGQFEQWLNAYYVEKLGYGMMCSNTEFSVAKLETFAERRGEFRANLAGKSMNGNNAILAKLTSFIPGGDTPQSEEPGNSMASSTSITGNP